MKLSLESASKNHLIFNPFRPSLKIEEAKNIKQQYQSHKVY